MSECIMYVLMLFYIFIGIGCTSDQQKIASFEQTIIKVPCENCAQPNLHTSADGTVYLSWVETKNDSIFSFKFSVFEDGYWSEPQMIAQSDQWFVNWADFPSMVSFGNGDQSLAAHLLEMSADGTYDYDVHVLLSTDRGKTWPHEFIPHTDGVAAEHGFVSMIPYGKDRIFASWLDGRLTKSEGKDEHNHDSHEHRGPMTLRSAVFDINGQLFEEAELDGKVCDCCQTSAAITESGPIVAYRDRSDQEIRDISVVRWTGESWSDPVKVYNDNWNIYGCPVNGPAIGANKNYVAVAWFGVRDSIPEVKVAFSRDRGANFNPPVILSQSEAIGRVGLLLDDANSALVSWMDKTEEAAVIYVQKVGHDGALGLKHEVSTVSPSRRSGFPVITSQNASLYVAWTEVNKNTTQVKTAVIEGF